MAVKNSEGTISNLKKTLAIKNKNDALDKLANSTPNEPGLSLKVNTKIPLLNQIKGAKYSKKGVRLANSIECKIAPKLGKTKRGNNCLKLSWQALKKSKALTTLPIKS